MDLVATVAWALHQCHSGKIWNFHAFPAASVSGDADADSDSRQLGLKRRGGLVAEMNGTNQLRPSLSLTQSFFLSLSLSKTHWLNYSHH